MRFAAVSLVLACALSACAKSDTLPGSASDAGVDQSLGAAGSAGAADLDARADASGGAAGSGGSSSGGTGGSGTGGFVSCGVACATCQCLTDPCITCCAQHGKVDTCGPQNACACF